MDENSTLSFEDYSQQNGMTFWWATDFGAMLGYANFVSFTNAINKAITSCMAANIAYYDDFVRQKRIVDGRSIDDFKLSRFACYMVAMNADAKKPQVAKAQVYFAEQAEKINVILEGKADLDRLLIRDEVKTGNIALNRAASNHGVERFGLFNDAGYRGLYNKGIKDVKRQKGLKPTADHFDYMGRTELAANLFRITLTEERLSQNEGGTERGAMNIHKAVGSQVRKMVKENTGKNPEDLKVERRLGEVKKELKKATKKLNSQDNTPKQDPSV
jgi:DNA-damage-inducible protein D